MHPQEERVYRAVGRRLRELRKARSGLTQQRLANAAGFDPAFVSRVERGRTAASLSTIAALCGALGVSLKVFFEPFEGQPRPQVRESAVSLLGG